VVNAVEDKKAENIVLLDLRPDAIIADFFVICTAGSDRQIRAIADGVRESIKEKYRKLPVSVEGQASSGWVLMDYGDTIIHIFGEREREYYNLEGFWRQANVLLSIQ
jgi:ribosome-associated protein